MKKSQLLVLGLFGCLLPNLVFACITSPTTILSVGVFVISSLIFIILGVLSIINIKQTKKIGRTKIIVLTLALFFVAMTFVPAYGYYKEKQEIKKCKERGNQFCNPLTDCL